MKLTTCYLIDSRTCRTRAPVELKYVYHLINTLFRQVDV